MKLIAFMVTTTSRMVSVTLRSGSSENTPPFGSGSQGSAWPLQTRMPAAAACQQQPGLAPRPGGPERILHKRQPTGQEKPGDKAAVHGQAAQQGGRLGVRVPCAGFVNGAGGDRHPPHQ